VTRRKAKVTIASIAERLRKAPPAPDGMSPDAAAVWLNIAPLMAKAGLLHRGSLDQLGGYCMAIAMVRRCDTAIARDGAFPPRKGLPQAHPAVKLQAEHAKLARTLANQLGITPRLEKGSEPAGSLENTEDDGLGDL